MLVLAPKLPGEECVISVSVGENEQNKVQFDELFDYIIQTNVSTIAGGMKGTTMPEGTTSLIGSYFSSKPESGIAVDKHDNLYVRFSIDDGGKHRVYMMNEEAGNIKVLNDFGILVTGILLSTDLATGNVYWYHTNIGNKGYGYFDPVADYANTNMGDIKWDHDLFYTDGNFAPVWNAIQTFTMCPADNKFYFYTNEGVVARWDPATGKGEDLTSSAIRATPTSSISPTRASTASTSTTSPLAPSNCGPGGKTRRAIWTGRSPRRSSTTPARCA